MCTCVCARTRVVVCHDCAGSPCWICERGLLCRSCSHHAARACGAKLSGCLVCLVLCCVTDTTTTSVWNDDGDGQSAGACVRAHSLCIHPSNKPSIHPSIHSSNQVYHAFNAQLDITYDFDSQFGMKVYHMRVFCLHPTISCFTVVRHSWFSVCFVCARIIHTCSLCA